MKTKINKNSRSRQGFEVAGKISSTKEWEELDYYWLDKSFEERMRGLYALVENYLMMNNLPKRLDKSIAGRRIPLNVQ